MRAAEILRSMDWVALGATGLLVAIGLAMLISATYTEQVISGLFIRQGVATLIALAGLLAFAFIHYRLLMRWSVLLYAIGLAGLIVVALFGTLIRGTVSRLEFFGVQVQPSEFMKIGIVLLLAFLASRLNSSPIKFAIVSFCVLALPVALVLLEPDTGAAVLLITIWLGILLFQGLPWKGVLIVLVCGALAAAAAWQWALLDYQRERLLTFLDPTRDPLGAGYNITQSIVALGSGELLGRGLGHGPQSQLKFLPERHTDFILASIGEELGFLGVLLVLGLYAVLLWRILVMIRSTREVFVRVASVGVFFLLLVSLAVSAGMNMGLLPVTGIALPLVSYGGSNLVTIGILLGILQSMRVHGKWTASLPPEITHF